MSGATERLSITTVAYIILQGGLRSRWLHMVAKNDLLELQSSCLSQSDAYSGGSECRGEPALQGQTGVQRVVTSPGGGGTNMGPLRSICVKGKRAVLKVFFSAQCARFSRRRCIWLLNAFPPLAFLL